MSEQFATGDERRVRRNRVAMIGIAVLGVLGFALAAAPVAHAAVETGIEFATATGLAVTDVRIVAARIIRTFLGLLGIVGVGIVLYGGFLWMTANGDEERITTAKRLLVNGAIGLAIVLSAFSIAQFVLSRLVEATIPGTVTLVDDENPGVIPPTGTPGGCVDPDPNGTEPHICSISPTTGPVGSYVTFQGYRFGEYLDGVSRVTIGTEVAPVVACASVPNWSDNLVVVEVPDLAADAPYAVALVDSLGTTATHEGLGLLEFRVTTAALGPQIACVRPNEGAEGASFVIEGKVFGETQAAGNLDPGAVRFTDQPTLDVPVTSWSDREIIASVPVGASSGRIAVVRGTAASNRFPFTVICSSGAECSSGCCVQNACYLASACAPIIVGQPCDVDPNTPQCEPAACATGLSCAAATCTCVETPCTTDADCDAGYSCDAQTNTCTPTTCTTDADCGAGETCDEETNTCIPDTLGAGPTILAVSTAHHVSDDGTLGAACTLTENQTACTPNGAPENYLTIFGSGFGATRGSVTIGGVAAGFPEEYCLIAPWSDDRIIVVILNSAADGPIAVTTAAPDARTDVTNDPRGPRIPDFVRNDIERPGICYSPGSVFPGSRWYAFGSNLGSAAVVRFGTAHAVSNLETSPTYLETMTPETLAPNQTVETLVEDAAGERSNIVRVAVLPTNEGPTIVSISPTSGGPGQYVTITGTHFGDDPRYVFFEGIENYTNYLIPAPIFPEQCTTSDWWRDDQIIVRIPDRWDWSGMADRRRPFSEGTYRVVVDTSDGGSAYNEDVQFTVTDTMPTPGICAVEPVSGPVGTPVTIVGEHFGSANGLVLFGNTSVLESALTGWRDALVQTSVPSGVPAGTTALRLWHRDDRTAAAPERGSNAVAFGVFDCRDAGGGTQCAEATFCCPATGTCVTNASACLATPNTGAYRWSFSTGTAVRAPRVVEACDVPSLTYSPSPWDQHAGGTSACTNANIRVQFNASMDLDADSAAAGTAVYRCNADANIAASASVDVGANAAALSNWRVASAATAGTLANDWVSASRVDLGTGANEQALGYGVALRKITALVANPVAVRAEAEGIPNDASLDRYAYALEAPADLLTNTNGTTYRVSVQFRGTNTQTNPNMRAGVVIGRAGGPDATDAGWWQQAAAEAVVRAGADGWQTLTTTISFDRGANTSASGFVRLYVTAPVETDDVRAAGDDVYAVEFRGLELTRDEGDACLERSLVESYAVSVASGSGWQDRTNNVVTIAPPVGETWESGRWYEVLVYGTAEDGKTPLLGANALALDGDLDGLPGGNYRFRFRTGSSECAIERVLQTPRSATATEPGPALPTDLVGTADLAGLAHIRADGVSDSATCQTITTGTAQPQWSVTRGADAVSVDADGGRWCVAESDCATIACASDADCTAFGAGATCDEAAKRCTGTSFCNANRCAFTPSGAPGNIFANTATARAASVETPEESPALVKATFSENRVGVTEVNVRFTDPMITAVYPTVGCAQACLNPAIIAMVNVDLNATTVTPFAVDPRTAPGATGSVALFRCADDGCEVEDMVFVPLTEAHACASGVGACTGRLGDAAQIVASVPALTPNTKYRVVVKNNVASAWGDALAGASVSGVDSFDLDGDGTSDAFEWTFTTGDTVCSVAEIAIHPNPVPFSYVGQRRVVSATPLSIPDVCSPIGQPLVAAYPWDWSIANTSVAGFTSVTAAGVFSTPSVSTFLRTAPASAPSCSLQCLLPGSSRLTGICGNGDVEVGEECEPADGAWCDPTTCLRKPVAPFASGGTCGDGIVDANMGEECEAVRVCSGGQISGTECTDDARCGEGSTCALAFPEWFTCDETCQNKGSGFRATVDGDVSQCGTLRPPARGEDCEDENTTSGDGCSRQCKNEGTLPMYNAASQPNGPLAICGNGTAEPLGGEECDLGPALATAWAAARCDFRRCVLLGNPNAGILTNKCGNGVVDDASGEQCDNGAVGSCDAFSGNAGAWCSENSDCTFGATGAPSCVGRAPRNGDGCSSSCLREGPSLAHRNALTGAATPSICGDSYVHPGEACDLGTSTGDADGTQVLQAVGGAPVLSDDKQETTVNIGITNMSAQGTADVVLQCGFTSDAQCAAAGGSATVGVDARGCCALRPTIIAASRTPDDGAVGVCRNPRVRVRFDQRMDPTSVGLTVDRETDVVTATGAELLVVDDGNFVTVDATPRFMDVVLGPDSTVSELTFILNEALDADALYGVSIIGSSSPERALRSADGVMFAPAGESWSFTTGATFCALDTLAMIPDSIFLNTHDAALSLRVDALDAHGDPIVPIAGQYDWTYAWESLNTSLATVVADGRAEGDVCTEALQCASRSCPNVTGDDICVGPAMFAKARTAVPAKNGESFATVTATITEDTVLTPPTVGSVTPPKHAPLRVFLCEQPWPAVSGQTWNAYPRPGTCYQSVSESDPVAVENTTCFTSRDCPSISGAVVQCSNGDVTSSIVPAHLALSYCRDFGTARVCRDPGAVEAASAVACTSDSECESRSPALRCLAALRDDLPAFSIVPGEVVNPPPDDGVDALRREWFFLPRAAAGGQPAYYCSQSGERCDPNLPGFCPTGELCRPGDDAIGVRLFENEGHRSAAAWYERQGFSDAAEPVTVDGYRGVRSGRSTYVNIANTGSLYTNIVVLSHNNGASEETRTIFARVLDALRFNTNLAAFNYRVCRDDATRACTSDLDCAADSSCDAPKDKLTRDTRRLEDLTLMDDAIAEYRQGQGKCSMSGVFCFNNASCATGETCLQPTPDLLSGTFIPGLTTSRWPSWQQELGRILGIALPTDPLNLFGGACVPESRCGGVGVGCTSDSDCTNESTAQRACLPDATYEQATCWNETNGHYTRPAGSYVYEYQRDAGGIDATVSAALEYAAQNWTPALPSTIATAAPSSTAIAKSASGVCGDGVVNIGENCEPSVTPTLVMPACDTNADGTNDGFQYQTCRADCKWSAPSACVSKCGNGVVDTDEQCDVGPNGGRVPAGHPVSGTVPGITGGTQYQCTATCVWAGGYCGDNALQEGFGEQCDNGAGLALTPAVSSAAQQYACWPSTSTTPCQFDVHSGYCGDGIAQINFYENCDGPKRESCLATGSGGTGTFINGVFTIPEITYLVRNGAYAPYTFDALGNGSATLVVVTSNSNSSVEELTKAQIEARLTSGQVPSDFNPYIESGGVGIYHHISVRIDGAEIAGSPFWALASRPAIPQVTELLLTNLTAGSHTITVSWDNDWYGGAGSGLDSNLKLHRLELTSTREMQCFAPGTDDACTLDTVRGWSACTATLLCGDGTVDKDKGEACDDGGAGRCTTDLRRVCHADRDCGAGGFCDRNVDACTSSCEIPRCGDGYRMVATCTAPPDRVGASCTTNTDCGTGGVCGSEACDLGESGNWRQVCVNSSDTQCVPNAACGYGRTCNYCTTSTCTVVGKQGGFCGDRVLQDGKMGRPAGEEQCDFVQGTNQVQTLTDPVQLAWNAEICAPNCASKCPDVYEHRDASFTSGNPDAVSIRNKDVKSFVLPNCRMLGDFAFDVELGDGVGVMNVVLVTDRSGSMDWTTPYGGVDYGADCDGDGSKDSGMFCLKRAVAGSNGFIDRIFSGRGGQPTGSRASRVRLGLVSFGSDASVDAGFLDVGDIQELKEVVNNYTPNGTTNTQKGISDAATLLTNDRGSGADVIILMTDGNANDVASTTTAADSFKGGPNNFLYTIFFGTPTVDAGGNWTGTAATSAGWATSADYAFAGTDVESAYRAIVERASRVVFTIFPGSASPPTAETTVSFSGTDLMFDATGLSETCTGPGDTTYKIRPTFFGDSKATVTLRNPSARVCGGPPWP